MKKIATVFVFIFSWLLMPSLAEAQIWIVNNNYDGAGHFNNAQDAHDAASAGDTLYLVPSEFEYEVDLTKELHLIGNGYLLDENEITGFSKTSTLNARILESNGGGHNSTFSSLITNLFYIEANGVKIKNCYLESVSQSGSPSDITVIKSYVNGDLPSGGPFVNSLIINNKIKGDIRLNGSTIINNVIRGVSNGEYSTIENNIFLNSTGPKYLFNIELENTINNNIFTISEPGNPGTDNQFDVDPSTLFIGPEGNSTDGQWMLSDTSPAKGAGTNGDDIGMYGGANPYQLSGLPDIPRITAFTAPATGSSNTGLPVSITIESNN